jgi:hypothetical protein
MCRPLVAPVAEPCAGRWWCMLHAVPGIVWCRLVVCAGTCWHYASAAANKSTQTSTQHQPQIVKSGHNISHKFNKAHTNKFESFFVFMAPLPQRRHETKL